MKRKDAKAAVVSENDPLKRLLKVAAENAPPGPALTWLLMLLREDEKERKSVQE